MKLQVIVTDKNMDAERELAYWITELQCAKEDNRKEYKNMDVDAKRELVYKMVVLQCAKEDNRKEYWKLRILHKIDKILSILP